MDLDIFEKASYIACLHKQKLAINEMNNFNTKYINQFKPQNKCYEYTDNIHYAFTDKNNCIYERPAYDFSFIDKYFTDNIPKNFNILSRYSFN